MGQSLKHAIALVPTLIRANQNSVERDFILEQLAALGERPL
jgi:hypothetical protein